MAITYRRKCAICGRFSFIVRIIDARGSWDECVFCSAKGVKPDEKKIDIMWWR